MTKLLALLAMFWLLPLSAQPPNYTLISDPVDVTSEWAELEIDGINQPCDSTTTCLAGGMINYDVTTFAQNPPRKFDVRARSCRVNPASVTECSGWTPVVPFDFTVPAVPSGLRVVAG